MMHKVKSMIFLHMNQLLQATGLRGFWTLLKKELLRFWRVVFQTVAAPVITAVFPFSFMGIVVRSRFQWADNADVHFTPAPILGRRAM